MRRRPVRKSHSVRKRFNKQVHRTKAVNLRRGLSRGGIRL